MPINNQNTILDLIEKLDCEVILVSRHYLGSINHSLMTAAILKQRGIVVKGILFNGTENKDTESIIKKMSGLEILGRIDELKELTAEQINIQAQKLKAVLH